MPNLLLSPSPYHILLYGTLLGTEIFQSFIAGIVSFRALPRPAFATLQSALFPVYFGMQSALPILLALTLPEERTGIGRIPGGLSGVLNKDNRYRVLTPLVVVCATGVTNMVWLEPMTTKTMRSRKSQEVRDGKKAYDEGPHSSQMEKLNRRFAWLHGMSSAINVVGCVATVFYGFHLGGRMD
jgi:hypothetical protein